MAAVLACGPGAAVSHRSAAELLGLTERRTVLIDVIFSEPGGPQDRWHPLAPVPALSGRRGDRPRGHSLHDAAPERWSTWPECSASVAAAGGRGGGGPALARRREPWTRSSPRPPARRRSALRAILAPWRPAGEDRRPLQKPTGGLAASRSWSSGPASPQCNVELQIDGSGSRSTSSGRGSDWRSKPTVRRRMRRSSPAIETVGVTSMLAAAGYRDDAGHLAPDGR